MESYCLSAEDVRGVEELLDEFLRRGRSLENPPEILESQLLSHRLPAVLRRVLVDFRAMERAGVLLIRGLPIDDTLLEPTPEHWRDLDPAVPPTREEIYSLLIVGLLGDVFGWATQQDGRIVHNVLPIKEDAGKQLGSGSEELLWWHTEDAFHEHRADYLSLLCLRNPDGVATTYWETSTLDLSPADSELLRQEAYTIRPDESHLPQNSASPEASDVSSAQAYAAISAKNSLPQQVSVLLGNAEAPYTRLDPYFMHDFKSQSHEAAFRALCAQISDGLRELVLEPGDIVLLDNYRAVHGRVPFRARFDGTDRWLKRLNIARNLRPSRQLRPGNNGRVIYG